MNRNPIASDQVMQSLAGEALQQLAVNDWFEQAAWVRNFDRQNRRGGDRAPWWAITTRGPRATMVGPRAGPWRQVNWAHVLAAFASEASPRLGSEEQLQHVATRAVQRWHLGRGWCPATLGIWGPLKVGEMGRKSAETRWKWGNFDEDRIRRDREREQKKLLFGDQGKSPEQIKELFSK
eukprot:Skav233812  [mRNA]  locus=scaffold658:48828:50528:+ [translate_table: standard]